ARSAAANPVVSPPDESIGLPAAAAAAASPAAASAATAAILRFVDAQRASAHVASVQLVDRLIGVPVVHFDEPEAARAASLAVGDHCHRVDLPDGGKEIPEVRLGGAPGEVADIDLLHLLSLLAHSPVDLPGVTWVATRPRSLSYLTNETGSRTRDG